MVNTAPAARPDLQAAAPSMSRRALVASSIGAFLEWYDFFVYGTMATIIAPLFFPNADPVSALLATFAVYGVAFVARPVGAVVFGHVGDRIGRKPAFTLSIGLMVVATLAIGFAPTYGQIGVAATVWLVAARLAQGFSTGGEFGGGTAFVLEMAPPGRRGLYGCVQAATTGLGVLAGTGVGALLSQTLPETAMQGWGWRIPFLLAVPLAVAGVLVRRRLAGPEFDRDAQRRSHDRTPFLETVTTHRRAVATSIGLVLGWTITAYVFVVYLPSYLTTRAGLPLGAALTVVMLGVVAWVASIVGMGALSDRVGRRPVLMGGAAAVALLTFPAFALLGSGSAGAALAALVPMMVALGAMSGPTAAALAELVPARVRYTAVGLGFGLCSAVFGGSAPYLATFLVSSLHALWLLEVYVVVAALVTLVVAAVVRESAHAPLPRD
jgi:MFS transporter, MHS family, proline/betaine transporter